MEKRFFKRIYDSINCSLNNLYVNNDDNKMSNNKEKFESELYFCELNSGEFLTLYYDGINFHSQTRTYKQEEVKTFNKIIYEQ